MNESYKWNNHLISNQNNLRTIWASINLNIYLCPIFKSINHSTNEMKSLCVICWPVAYLSHFKIFMKRTKIIFPITKVAHGVLWFPSYRLRPSSNSRNPLLKNLLLIFSAEKNIRNIIYKLKKKTLKAKEYARNFAELWRCFVKLNIYINEEIKGL